MIRAARLRNKVTIERKAERQDSMGALIQDFAPLLTRSAEVTELSKDESVETGIHFNKRQIKVLMRYNDSISYEMFVLYRNVRYSIVDMAVDANRKELTLTCEVLDG